MEGDTIVTIIASSLIALGIAFFVKYGVKPKIETVYENNRNSIIKRLLIDVHTVSNQFNNAHEIFERQNNFQAWEQMSYDLTVNEVTGLEHITEFIRGIFDYVKSKRDVLLNHLKIGEYEAILNYLGNTMSFYTIPQNVQPHHGVLPVIYLSTNVETMRHFGWRIINMFPQIINYEFIQNMRKYDNL